MYHSLMQLGKFTGDRKVGLRKKREQGTRYRTEYYLAFSSWCGSANIVRCVEIKQIYQWRIHPGRYYRRGGRCIECKAEWERRERAEREQNRLKRLEKKVRDTNIADFGQIGYGKRKQNITETRKTSDDDFTQRKLG